MKILQLRILSRLRNRFLRYNEMAFRSGCRVTAQEFQKRAFRAGERVQKINMRRYIFTIALRLAASVASGAIFLFALIQQFALVEVAASLVTTLQVLFLGSAIADLLEKPKGPGRRRNSLVVLFTVFLVAFYSFTRYFR